MSPEASAAIKSLCDEVSDCSLALFFQYCSILHDSLVTRGKDESSELDIFVSAVDHLLDSGKISIIELSSGMEYTSERFRQSILSAWPLPGPTHDVGVIDLLEGNKSVKWHREHESV